jgi:hypothetical protein
MLDDDKDAPDAKKDNAKGDSAEDLLADAKKAFTRAEEAESKNRENWVDDVRFARLGEQWPEAVRKQREQDGRPCLTINRLPAFIRQVTNDARQNKPSIKFHPVGDGADEETAKVLVGLTRNIEYASNADVAYDNALDNSVSGGFGYWRVATEYAEDDAFDQDIRIEPIKNPLTVYGDPMSTCSDSADWDECFVTELWAKAAFKKKWPEADAVNFDADSHDRATGWFQGGEIRVAEWWTREDVPATLLKLSNGSIMFQAEYDTAKELLDLLQVTIAEKRQTTTKKVTQRIITGAEILETNAWAGKYIPIVPVYGDEVMVDGERHFLSLVRFAKDPQQNFNYWRTASTELVALAPKTPFIGAVGSFATDAAKWASANTATHAYIEYDVVFEDGAMAPPPQRQQFAGPPAGALQEAANSSDDMKAVMGLFDASMGAQSNETSGRAILARQREGDVSTFNFTDNLSRAIRHTGRIIADLIPKTYSTARIIRVIHEDGTNKNVAINGAQMPAPAPATTPQEQQKQQEEMQAIARVFDLTTGKYDVTCESGPSYTTKREEAAAQMTEFMRAVPASAALIGDLLAKNLDWPGADDIAERLKSMLPPQAQGQNPQLQQAQQQMQQMQQAIEHLKQQLADAGRDKSIEERKLDIDANKADTDRIKALGLTLAPEIAAAMGYQMLPAAQQAMSGPDITPGGAPPAQQPQPMAPPDQRQPQLQQPPTGGFFSPDQQQQPQGPQ